MRSIVITIPECPGCCCPCPPTGTLQDTIASVVYCLGLIPGESQHFYEVTAGTDPNGVHELDYTSNCQNGDASLVIGTVTVDYYYQVDPEPAPPEYQSTVTADLLLTVACSDGVMTTLIFAILNFVTGVDTPFTTSLIFFDSAGEMEESTPNTLTCGEGQVGAEGGTSLTERA